MKYGFLFGAGAEIVYGLPSGGRFALDIFRFDASESKILFKEMRDMVDPTTYYASQWLPYGYMEKTSVHLERLFFKILSKIQWSTTEIILSKESTNLMRLPQKKLLL